MHDRLTVIIKRHLIITNVLLHVDSLVLWAEMLQFGATPYVHMAE